MDLIQIPPRNRGHYMSYGQNLVHGEGTSLSRVGPYRFCSGGSLYKPSWGYRFGYRFRVGPYRFCSNSNPTTLLILLWSCLILSDTHMTPTQTVHDYKGISSKVTIELLFLLDPTKNASMTLCWKGNKHGVRLNVCWFTYPFLHQRSLVAGHVLDLNKSMFLRLKKWQVILVYRVFSTK